MTVFLRCLIATLALTLAACDRSADSSRDSGAIDLSQLRGQQLVINYWASWCTPCREEIPELNAFSERYRDSARVFAVNFDKLQGEALSAAAADMGIAFELLAEDPATALGYATPQVLPTTVIIGADGQVQKVLAGPQTLEDLVAASGQEMQP